MVETLTLFFVILAAGGVAAVVAILIGAVVTKLRLPGSNLVGSLAAEVRPLALALAFLAAATAMAGSLYYSEGAHYLPCRMCWFQRFCMYPSAILLGASLLTRRKVLAWIAWGLSAVGICISIYHRFEQAYPDSVGGVCEESNPCSVRYITDYGLITIPTMAGVAFALVLVLVPLALLGRPKSSQSTTEKAAEAFV